jgi:hypothetical protein
MFIYNVSGYFFDSKSDEPNYIVEYITHKKQYTNIELNDICTKALLDCKFKNSFDLKLRLIKQYGFEDLKIESQFEFEEGE